jgi:hypothetical protein
VDLAVEVPTNDSTYRNNKRCHEGDAAVDRAKPEICVPQNQHRSEDAENHVGAEPESDRPNYSQRSDAFSQGVQHQDQHKAAPRNSEPITDAADGCQAIVVTVEPTDPEREDNSDAKNLGDDVRPPLRTISSKICRCARS